MQGRQQPCYIPTVQQHCNAALFTTCFQNGRGLFVASPSTLRSRLKCGVVRQGLSLPSGMVLRQVYNIISLCVSHTLVLNSCGITGLHALWQCLLFCLPRPMHQMYLLSAKLLQL